MIVNSIWSRQEKNIIEKVFVIPKEELGQKRFITITSTTVGYKKFEIDKKSYTQAYEDMKARKCQILEDEK